MSTWAVDVNILQKQTQTVDWLYLLLDLPLKLVYLKAILLQLSIQDEEVTEEFGKMLVSLFYLFGKSLLMVLIKFKAANYLLLADVKQWHNHCTFASSDDFIPISNILILVSALLAYEDITHRLLNVLEVKGDTVRLLKHLVNQILAEANRVFRILLR